MKKRKSKSRVAKSSKPRSGTSAARAPDALALLTADHEAVKSLFKKYGRLCKSEAGSDEKERLAAKICEQLTIHAQIEEEVFYPALRDALDDEAIVNEADVEHASAKDLIVQIENSMADDLYFDAKVIVLGEYIDHHVAEEQGEMFRKARKAKLDLVALGRQLKTRKAALQAGLGLAPDGGVPAAQANDR